MADQNTPVVVSPNAGIIDLLTAAGRLLLVIVGAVPILLRLLGAHDFAGLVAYFQSSTGATLFAAVSGLAALVYGLYKSHKRGAQVASVATNPDVPDRIATTK